MAKRKTAAVEYAVLELGESRYAVVAEEVFVSLCRRAGLEPLARPQAGSRELPADAIDAGQLAARLAARRSAAGLSQAELARRAGVRIETVNRIERGHVTPDFSTIRKLVSAIQAAESEAKPHTTVSGATKGATK